PDPPPAIRARRGRYRPVRNSEREDPESPYRRPYATRTGAAPKKRPNMRDPVLTARDADNQRYHGSPGRAHDPGPRERLAAAPRARRPDRPQRRGQVHADEGGHRPD